MRDTRLVATASSVELLATAGTAMLVPFLSIYFVEERGLALTTYGTFMLLLGLVASAAQVIGGGLATRRAGVVISASLSTGAVVAGLLGWASWAVAPLAAVFGLVAVHRLAHAFYGPAIRTVVAAGTPAPRRLLAFSWLRFGGNVAWALGPALAGVLVDAHYLWLFAALVPLQLAGAIGARRLPTTAPATAAEGAPLSRPSMAVVGMLSLGFLFVVATSQLHHLLPMFVRREQSLDATDIGLLFSINGVLVLALQLPVGRVLTAVSPPPVIALGGALYAVAFVVFASAATLFGLVAGMVILTLGETMLSPALPATLTRLVAERSLGPALGWLGAVRGVGRAVGAVVAGLLYDSGAPAWEILAGTTITVSAAAYVFVGRAQTSERANPAEDRS